MTYSVPRSSARGIIIAQCRRTMVEKSALVRIELRAALLMCRTLARRPDLIEEKTTELTIGPLWESHRDRPKASRKQSLA